jgi:hypothetical protein
MASGDGQPAETGTARGSVPVMTLLCAAQFVLQLDFSVVNVTLPTIQREMDVDA